MIDSSNSIELDTFSKISIEYCYKVWCIPKSYTDAMNYVDTDSWQSAMFEEIDSLKISNTSDLVVAPRDADIIKSRLVLTQPLGYTIKRSPTSSVLVLIPDKWEGLYVRKVIRCVKKPCFNQYDST